MPPYVKKTAQNLEAINNIVLQNAQFLKYFFVNLFLLKMDVSKKSMKKKYDYLMTKSGISISFPMKVGKMCGCT